MYAGEELLSQTKNGTSTLFISSFQDTDDILAKVENGNILYFHKDHLGSIVAITNNSGTIVAEYSYDAFGKVRNISGDADFENTLLYTGREYDKEIGLYFYRARYYDPELGRFISQDPIGIEDDINLYAYVGNNPVNFTDPSGEKAKGFLRDPLSEETKARLEGVGKIVIGSFESIGGGTAVVGGAAICTTGVGCLGGGVAVAYGFNYLVSGSTRVGGGIHQLISGERNNAYFNAGHKLIDANIENKNTANNVKLVLDVADIGVGVVKGVPVLISKSKEWYTGVKGGYEVLEEGIKGKYGDIKEGITTYKADFDTGLEIIKNGNFYQPQLAGNIQMILPKPPKTADDLAMKNAGKAGGGGWSLIKTSLVKSQSNVYKFISNSWHGPHDVHHIIPANFANKYPKLIEDLNKQFGGNFDINGSYNGVFLPSKVHGNHFKDYDDIIIENLNIAVNRGYSKEQIISMLANIRKEMLKGGSDNKYALTSTRKSLSNGAQEFKDMQATINLYK